MKLKINKACDLSSISVLPPHSRRGNAVPPGADTSVFSKSQGSSQFWSQSQQSFSQGMSMSQLSQNSQEEIMTNEHRFGSQDNSLKRISCLAPVTYTREDNQMPMSRSSNNVIRRWSSTSAPDNRCHVNEELEHRIGLMETSLNRLGMVLESVQSDVMQVNKAVKEVSLEMGGIQQKMIVHDNSLQLVLKGEDDIKASLDVNLKAISDQLRKESNQHKLDKIESTLSALPVQIETRLLKLQNELYQTFIKEMAIISSMKPLNENHQPRAVQPPKRKSCIATPSLKKQQPVMENPVAPPKFCTRRGLIPNIEVEKPLKPKTVAFTDTKHTIELKQEEVTIMKQEQDCRVLIESDEEIDGGFSFLLEEKEIGKGNHLMEDAREETKRILKKARRRRRQCCNPIILV
ncbi:putative recombination initiation defects 3 isoform X1 [Magnolia sinica]|uniref:putative recombination initiation defects 3 isoform X1 n=1 Tax=Magnolia sinica TaxID=86752 RepID=UPI0026590355|nr:putative recombination initiation defects 3 isoform X1 [Magnolia sinica]